MNTSDRVLAGRYAKALFLAAVAQKEEEKVQKDFAEVNRALMDARGYLRHPRVSPADKKKKLNEVLGGKVSALTIKFLGMLIDKKRFELLPLVGATVTKLVAEKKNVAKAVVRTARPISSDAQAQLKKKLETFSGKTVELDMKEDAELIGGLTVRIGDWILDSSLRGQLRRLKETFNGN
jgi:F-type H+-transporting ATPase subunit delta